MNDACTALTLGARLACERVRGWGAPLSLLLACSALYALGALGRHNEPAAAVDNVLGTPVFGLCLPLLAYFVSERVCGGQRLDRSVDTLARHGADRRFAVLGVLLASATISALVALLLALSAVLAAHNASSASLLFDLRSSLGIALLAGSVYALWFGAASLLGKRGGGRKWALILDFILGSTSSALAAPCPRAHVRNLLGGEPMLDVSQAHAWLALVAIGVVCAAWSVTRTTE